MTDRIGDPHTVCPFVAFDDDRDHRGPGPDHRHRCFAETPAAPRALAHQAAYCLSAGFAGCPTFLDWARREAAPVRQESPVRSLRDAPAVRGGPAPADPAPSAALAASAALGTGGEPLPDDARWAAPPSSAADDAASRSEGFPADDGSPGPADAPSPAADGPPFLAGRSSRVPASPPVDDAAWAPPAGPTDTAIDDPYAPPSTHRDERYGEVDDRPASPPVAEPRRSPVGYAPVAPSRTDQRPVAGAASRSGREHRDVSAPAWEEPRRHDSYPTLKARRGTAIPRPLAYALIVLVAGIALFMVPFLLNGLGGGDGDASPTPAASEPVEPTAEPTITPEPTPEEIVYVVKAGDTLSKIAAANDVTVDQILEANPGITNPNQIAVGDRIVIPQALPSEIVDDAITPEP